ncbi:ABC transporter permease [Staphylococcus americanisciuri]|uniref:Transport permease protein n=1 Tax=Staphylococcus americanisciuri TaxID=2973940 RepID=A0ABT2EZY4_9STAP|nr:ABC transporter permease [Staphylococcus americanisciuri]MCS4485764.1 ABC transporter permease [Staphylococcus americanisciuri]
MFVQEFREKSNLGIGSLAILINIEFKAFWRNKNILITQVVQPTIYFLFLVMGLGGSLGTITYYNMDIQYQSYALIGVLGLLIISQMTQTIYRTTIDKRWGLLSLKFLSGVKPFYYMIGMSTYPAIGFTVQSLLLYLLALPFHLEIGFIKFVLVILIGIISLLFWTSIGIMITTYINDYQKRDTIIAMMMLPLGFSAPTFYLAENVPHYINIVASINPLTYQVNAMRNILFGIHGNLSLALTIGFTALSLMTGVWVLKRSDLVIKEN